MPGMGHGVTANAKKIANVHTNKGHAILKRAIKKLVLANVFKKHGKPLKAAKTARFGKKALNKAIGHYTRAAHAKAKIRSRFKAHKRRGGGGGGGLGGIIGTVGNVLGGILGGI